MNEFPQVNDVSTSTISTGALSTGKKRKLYSGMQNAYCSKEECLNRINSILSCGCRVVNIDVKGRDGNCFFRSIWLCMSKIMDDAGESEIGLNWCLGTDKLNLAEKEIEAATFLRWTLYDIATRLLPFKVRNESLTD